MIVRDCGNDFGLIHQHDHALLAGEWAKHVGNSAFSPPIPFDSVIRAVNQHDAGWPMHDEYPSLLNGQPRHVFQMPPSSGPKIWQKSVDIAMRDDPYSGLLVSLHSMNLANFVLDRIDRESDSSREDFFRLNQFLHRQIEIQEELRTKLDMHIDLPLRRGLAEEGRSAEEDLLRANYFLLQLLDRMSLNICFDQLLFDSMELVYPKPGGKGISVQMSRIEKNRLRVNPWPFDQPLIEAYVPIRKFRKRKYIAEEFQPLVAESIVELITVRIQE